MSSSDEWARTSGEGDGAVRPRMGLADLILQLWRAKWLMILVFLPIFALGLLFAYSMTTTYESRSRLIVALGDEYVYNPNVGDGAAGTAPEIEEIVQTELDILRSPRVAERVLSRFPLDVVYPELAKGCDERIAASKSVTKRERMGYECFQLGVSALQRNFGASAPPKSPVILTTYENEDPIIAAEVLNAMIKEYIGLRSEVFVDRSSGNLGAQRRKFEEELLQAEDRVRNFLVQNRIGNFDSEADTVRQLYTTASGELFTNETRISQVNGQLNIYRQQLASIDPDINLFVEDTTDQTLLNLELEREDLLARYKPGSRPVKELDKRIAATKAFMAAQSGPQGTTRRGPNPVFQEIETAVSNLEAEANALTDQRKELRGQLSRLEGRQMRLTQLQPEYQELLRERDLLEAQASAYREREVEAMTRSELAQQNADNIRVIEPGRPAVEGKSLRMPIALLAFLFAGFTALMAGLLRAMTRDGFSTARSVERTTGLPVIASVGER